MTEKIVTREASNPDYHWDLTSLYQDDSVFEASLNRTNEQLNNLVQFRGKLGSNSQTLLNAIELILELERQVGNVIVYAHLKNDQDKGNGTYQDMYARAGKLAADFSKASAYFQPELLSIPEDQISLFLSENSDLQLYNQYLDNLYREKDHILSEEIESILAQGAQFFSGNSQTFGYLNNADLVFPVIQDEQGESVQLTHGNFIKMLDSTHRSVRQAAFEAFYGVYHQFENTLASILGTEIKKYNYLAKIRNFDSARQASLFSNNVPESVYDTLVKCVNSRIDLLHRYVSIRKEILGVESLEMYDMYTPILGEPPIKFGFQEAKTIIIEALKPLGESYVEIIEKAFEEKWIDVFENKGKRSGAYSSGSYDSNPFILMNYQDGIDSMYTLIHELGHSLHTYLTNQHQPYVYSHYSIFLAEIASTTNENLLTSYLLKKYDDKDIQLYVLNHFLDGIKGTVFRQTQFAEFEHLLYSSDAQGIPLTANYLNNEYQKINEKYYGPEVNSNSEIAYEWSRIPHFYYNYYVFQYATGFSAATAFSERILTGETEEVEKYLGFLKSGNADYPIPTMITAGLDMTEEAYIQATLDAFENRLNQFESLLHSNQ